MQIEAHDLVTAVTGQLPPTNLPLGASSYGTSPMACETGYFALLKQWFSGTEVRECPLFYTNVFVLGRWGKIFIYISGFVILIEAFGEERIRKFGEDLERTREEITHLNHEIIQSLIHYLSIAIAWIAIKGSWRAYFHRQLMIFFNWLYENFYAVFLARILFIIFAVLILGVIKNNVFQGTFSDLPTVGKIVLIVFIIIYSPIWMTYSVVLGYF